MSTRDEHLIYLLTTQDYRAAGVVIREGDRFVGYDTSGGRIFDRKDVPGAQAAAEKKNLRVIAKGYYGISSSRPEGVSTAQHYRDREAEKDARARREADLDAWLPLGKHSATRRAQTRDRVDVIGEVTQARAGNTIIRAGHLLTEADKETPFSSVGWMQTAHIVLTPAERDWLIKDLLEQQVKHPPRVARPCRPSPWTASPSRCTGQRPTPAGSPSRSTPRETRRSTSTSTTGTSSGVTRTKGNEVDAT